MSFKKMMGVLHRWLGLASGLVVFIIGITGCLYAFIDEIKPVVYKDRMYVAVPAGEGDSLGANRAGTRLPVSQLREAAQKALGAQYPLVGAEVPVGADRTVSFRAVKLQPTAWLYSRYIEYYYRVYMDPYTGKVVYIENTKWEFFNVVVQLHTSLLLGKAPGRWIVDWSVVIFVIMLISGMILWWPRNKAAAKQRYWFRWKKKTQWKRKNYDLHNILGFYACLVLLVISLTGLVWAFEAVSHSVRWLANGGKTIAAWKAPLSDSTDKRAFPEDKILASAIASDRNAGTFFMSIPKDNKTSVFVYGRHDGEPLFHSVSGQYDQHSGALLARRSFRDLNAGEKTAALNYDLHVGSIMGLAGKVLAFFASLIAASLPVTGFYIWWGRRRKKVQPVTIKSPAKNSGAC